MRGAVCSLPVLAMSQIKLASAAPAAPAPAPATPAPAAAAPPAAAKPPVVDDQLRARWKKLDEEIRGWWDKDQGRADEEQIRADKAGTLLFQPLPFTTAAGHGSAYPDLYAWDTQFINAALLLHGKPELALNNLRNHLFMIDRYGFILNGNRKFYLTRSQTPLVWWSVEELAARGGPKLPAKELYMEAYPRLEREYRGYWNAEHHKTPTGLARAFDLGDKGLRAELAAEAETGLDFTPIFGGDVRNTNPLIINSALVRYANTLSVAARALGMGAQSAAWAKEAKQRAAKMNALCWDDKQGFYFEYDYVKKQRLPYWSLLGYWPLWAGVASPAQAKKAAANLKRFENEFALATTAEEYPSPHKEFKRNQWAHPSAWPPLQITTVLALDRYGLKADARRVAARFLRTQLDTWDATGKLWERYDSVKGGKDTKFERAEAFPFHGWAAAAVVILGRKVFGDNA